jgi:hypothetical protein
MRPCAGGPVHGGPRSHAAEPRDSDVRSASLSGREGEEAGVDRVHAETAHDSQCDAEERDVMASGGKSAGLIFKTVADLPLIRVVGQDESEWAGDRGRAF